MSSNDTEIKEKVKQLILEIWLSRTYGDKYGLCPTT